MSDKSHVSMEQKICPICGKNFYSGAILLHKQMRQTLAPKTVTGWRICDDCTPQLDDNRIALVVTKPRPQWAAERRQMRPEEANRTGEIIWMRREAFRAVFNTNDVGEGGRLLPMAFIDEETAAGIKAAMPKDDAKENDNAR